VTIIGIGELRITREYLDRYLRWATHYASNHIPDAWEPEGEFGVVGADGSLVVVVPLVDSGGDWIATGIGPKCHANGWASDAGSVH